MTPSRSKTGLSETAKSFITLWYKEQLYSRRKEVSSKYMTKGNDCEEASIAYINSLYGTDYQKNEEHYDNDLIHGTPDIVTDDLIIDIKNSWDFSTFPLFSQELPNRDYMYQLQGYMHLTGARKASVVYTLMSLSDEQIEAEWRKAGNYNQPVTEEFASQYRYDGLDSKLRVKRFDFDYDPIVIEQIEAKVEEARKFISLLKY